MGYTISYEDAAHSKSNLPHRDCNFWIICHIINPSTLLGAEFESIYLDTAFVTIDQELVKLHPSKHRYPGIWKLH